MYMATPLQLAAQDACQGDATPRRCQVKAKSLQKNVILIYQLGYPLFFCTVARAKSTELGTKWLRRHRHLQVHDTCLPKDLPPTGGSSEKGNRWRSEGVAQLIGVFHKGAPAM